MCPVSATELEPRVFDSVTSSAPAVSARRSPPACGERGRRSRDGDGRPRAPLRPGRGDRGGRRARSSRGPGSAHVSGATPLAALDPHERRFGLHPLQTFTRSRGPEQLDGAFAAVTAETDEARAARLLARPRRSASSRSSSPTTARPLYHAGAAIASNYLVTLHAGRGRALPRRRRAARGARPADAADDRQRLRAHRPDRARRLGRPSTRTAAPSARRGPSSSRSTTCSRRRRRR